MSDVPGLRPSTPCSVTGLSVLFLAMCGLMHCLLCVCADDRTHQRTLYNGNTNTNGGSLNISDMCPGVEYLLNQNSTEYTILQANVSDCDITEGKIIERRSHQPEFAVHQGVVYGLCEDSTSFCSLLVQVPPAMYIRAHVQRLAYWCESRYWRTRILYHREAYGDLTCSYHTLEEMFFESTLFYMFIQHINSPLVKVDFETVKRHDFIVKYESVYSVFIIAPFYYGSNTEINEFSEEWTVPSRLFLLVSVQQTLLPLHCSVSRWIHIIYTEPNITHRRVAVLCAENSTSASIFLTLYLQIHIFYNWMIGAGLRIYISFLSENEQPQKLPSGLFNCSVNHYSKFQHHLHCDLKPECEDGRDETEHCPFSSPDCQGLVASRNKCFKIVVFGKVVESSFVDYKCQRVGGELASLKTRKEKEDSLHIFKNYYKFHYVIGCTSGWSSVPFMYSKFRKWSDNTFIYNMNHFEESLLYHPSRNIKLRYLTSMRFVHEDQIDHGENVVSMVLCEFKSQSQSVLHSQSVLVRLDSPQSTCSNTQQNLFVFPHSHVTHIFLLCDTLSQRGKTSSLQLCGFLNASDKQNTELPGRTKHTTAMFTCDDDATTVHYTVVCDFRQDCPGNSDESFCEQPLCGGFLCSNGQCVLHSQRCNEYSDCGDSFDEINCGTEVRYHVDIRKEHNKQQFHMNLDGTGYFTLQLMTAGESCPDTHYRCTAEWLYCLPVYTRCNGFSDCVYGEDEQDCERVVCPWFYRCRASRVCVHGDHLCDGWGQCPQRDDEWMCDMTCPENCLCQGHSFLCARPFSADLFSHLRYVDATGSGMTLIDFFRNAYLTFLNLSYCSLVNVSSVKLSNMQFIDLANNRLTAINISVFLEAPNLRNVKLANNPLSLVIDNLVVDKLVKHIHYELKRIDISNTHLEILKTELAIYLPQMKYIDVSFSSIKTIGSIGLKNIPKLIHLDIRRNPVYDFPWDLFSGLKHLKVIITSNYRFCCRNILPKHVGKNMKCSAPRPILSSCYNLLPTDLHRLFFLLVGMFTTVGNLLSFLVFFVAKNLFNSNFVTFISLFQVANICMGSHVGITVVANEILRGKYIRLENAWISSEICKMNSFLFFLSIEVSVLLILLIILDHNIILYLPRDSWSFSARSTAVACIVTWFAGILLSSVPFFPGLSHWGLYGQSGLCRLDLFDHYDSKQQFRWFTVIVTVNCVFFLIILPGQISLFRRIPKYRIALDPTKRSVYSSVHLMGKVVVTHVVCWFSFGLVIILATYGGFVLDLYGAMAVFMLPLNSAVNPLFYMWTVATQRKGRAREEKLLEVLKLRIALLGEKIL